MHHKDEHGLMMVTATKQKRNCLQQKILISKRQSLVVNCGGQEEGYIGGQRTGSGYEGSFKAGESQI